MEKLEKDMVYIYEGFERKSAYLIVSKKGKKITTMQINNKFIRAVSTKYLISEIRGGDIKIVGKYDGSELSTFVSRKFPEYLV